MHALVVVHMSFRLDRGIFATDTPNADLAIATSGWFTMSVRGGPEVGSDLASDRRTGPESRRCGARHERPSLRRRLPRQGPFKGGGLSAVSMAIWAARP